MEEHGQDNRPERFANSSIRTNQGLNGPRWVGFSVDAATKLTIGAADSIGKKKTGGCSKVRTSWPVTKRRTPTGTFLSNTMRNAVALGLGHDGLDRFDRYFKLLRYLGDTDAVFKVVDNGSNRQTGAPQERRAALGPEFDFDQRTI